MTFDVGVVAGARRLTVERMTVGRATGPNSPFVDVSSYLAIMVLRAACVLNTDATAGNRLFLLQATVSGGFGFQVAGTVNHVVLTQSSAQAAIGFPTVTDLNGNDLISLPETIVLKPERLIVGYTGLFAGDVITSLDATFFAWSRK